MLTVTDPETDTHPILDSNPDIPCDHENHGSNFIGVHDDGPAVAFLVWEPCPQCGTQASGFRCLAYVHNAIHHPEWFYCGNCGNKDSKVQRTTPI